MMYGRDWYSVFALCFFKRQFPLGVADSVFSFVEARKARYRGLVASLPRVAGWVLDRLFFAE